MSALLQPFNQFFEMPLEQIVTAISQTVAAPFIPSSRVYWVYLLVAFFLALMVVGLQNKRATTGRLRLSSVLINLFHRRAWARRSTLQDLGYWLFNGALRTLVIVPLVGSHLVATLWVTRTLQTSFGDGPHWALPLFVITAVYTLTFFIVEDASRFGLHRLMHKIPFLWRLHKVHHSATRLTPLTLFRLHPAEMSLYYLRNVVVFGVVSGVFVYLFGRQLSGWHVLGVDLLGFLFNLAGANLRHSHVWLPFGPLERVFISPAAHQLHHSRLPEHVDCNFGSCFSIWDQITGSHKVAHQKPKRLVFGIKPSA